MSLLPYFPGIFIFDILLYKAAKPAPRFRAHLHAFDIPCARAGVRIFIYPSRCKCHQDITITDLVTGNPRVAAAVGISFHL